LYVHEFIEVAQLQNIEVKLKKHKPLWNTVQDFANSGVLMGGQLGVYSPERTLRTHQHTSQSFKNKF